MVPNYNGRSTLEGVGLRKGSKSNSYEEYTRIRRDYLN